MIKMTGLMMLTLGLASLINVHADENADIQEWAKSVVDGHANDVKAVENAEPHTIKNTKTRTRHHIHRHDIVFKATIELKRVLHREHLLQQKNSTMVTLAPPG